MLSSAIKLLYHAFIPSKKSYFYKMKSFEKKKELHFFKVISTKMCFPNFLLEIFQEVLQTSLNTFSFGTLSEKSSSWFASWSVKYISQECQNFKFSYLPMEPESDFIFKNISSLANLNSPTNFEFKFLQIKLEGNGIQEKPDINDTVNIKSTFLAIWMIWKT